jgi:hypothetical protein
MKKIFFLMGLACTGLCAQAEGMKYYYLETTGASVKTLIRTIERTAGTVKMIYRDGDDILSEATCDLNFDQNGWVYKNMPEKIDLVFTRDANIIQCAGTHRGKDFIRRYEKDNVDWIQVFEFAVVPFLQSGKKEKECWSLRPTEMDAFKMVIIREGTEKITVRQQRLDAVKVRLTASGPLSMFWSAWYWYRVEDLVFVRYESVRGGPGTPLTVIELVKEEKLR